MANADNINDSPEYDVDFNFNTKTQYWITIILLNRESCNIQQPINYSEIDWSNQSIGNIVLFSRLPIAELDFIKECAPIMSNAFAKTRCWARLPPFKYWHTKAQEKWRERLVKFTYLFNIENAKWIWKK